MSHTAYPLQDRFASAWPEKKTPRTCVSLIGYVSFQNTTGGGYNYASYLVAHSLKMLPNGTFVVSYADTAWSHVGYVYQATNFLYTGMSAKRVDVFQPEGLHPRAYDKENHSDLMQTRSQKHRYVYLVGNKSTRRKMLKQLKYPVYDKYPKGDETPYNIENPNPIQKIEVVERKKPQSKRGS